MKLCKGGMKGNKTLVLIGVNHKTPHGKFQIGYIKGKGFKVRDLTSIRENGGEWSQFTKYCLTLKEAIQYALNQGVKHG